VKAQFGTIVFISAVLGCISAAEAVTIPLPVLADPTYFGNLQYGYWDGRQQVGSSNNPFVGQDIHLSGSSVSSASADALIDLSDPSLKVTGTATGPVVSVAGISLTYLFEVVGAPGGLAPVGVKASGLTSGTGTIDALNATLIVGEFGSPPVIYETLSAGVPGSWNVDQTFLFNTNVPITVTMTVEGVSEVNIGSGSYSAEIDPIFSVDSSSGYQLVFSPGIGNMAGGVPEPSTWAMILIGFAGLSFASYRARRNALNA
jgi:hypothetical protein